MDISTATTTPTATATACVKTPEAESEAPTRIQTSKPLSSTNGVLKRHQPLHHRHLNGPHVAVTYKECLKNHAASIGGHAVDGCGEFMPSPTANPTDPTSLKCAACGCHRNFHRREPEDALPPSANNAQHLIEYQPHHRHHPPPPRGGHSSPNSASPPPISSSYYPSAPHMLLALSAGLSGPLPETNPSMATSAGTNATLAANTSGRKRFRTKFTQDQKDRMHEFAERVGWKMQKRDEELISEFCTEVGVDKSVFKVWMHNNKNTYGKKDASVSNGLGIGIGFNSRTSLDNIPAAGTAAAVDTHYHREDNNDDNNHHHHQNLSQPNTTNSDSVSAHAVATNGSSSSS